VTSARGPWGAATWLILVCMAGPPAAAGQTALVTAGGGISAGDGGPAGTAVAAAGYLTGRRIGFELEIGVTPGLDLPGPDVVIQGTPGLSIFPLPTYEITGRLVTLHTNVIFELPATGRLRVFAVAGGGVGSLEQRVRIQRPAAVLGVPRGLGRELQGLGLIPPSLTAMDIRRTVSDTGLSLNGGGTVEYGLTERLGAGLDARYVHVFVNNRGFLDGGLDLARITGRVSWRF